MISQEKMEPIQELTENRDLRNYLLEQVDG